MDRLKEIIREIISRRSRYRRLVLSLSCVVVFVTTYLLILPAITLEKDKAAEQGGIDVPAAAVEETVDENTTDPDIDIDTGTETDIDKDIDIDIDTDANIADDSDSEEASDPSAKDADKQTADEKDGSVKSAKDTKSEGLVFEGDDYTVTVIDKNSILPEAVHVESEEIRGEDSKQKKAYDEYVTKTEEALGLDEGTVSYARVFDIKIVDSEGNKFDIPEPVDVSIKLADRDGSKGSKGTKKAEEDPADDLQVVHFEDGAEEGEVIESVTENEDDGSVVEFEAEGFSVYSIVEAPEEPVPIYQSVSTLDDIEENQEYYLSIARSGTNYMTSTRILNGATYELTGTTNRESGEKWRFESAGNGKVNIYYLDSEGKKMYLNVDNARNISFSDSPQALSIAPTTNAAGTFYIYTVIDNKNYALSVRSSRNFFFEQRNNGANANERVVLTKYMNDPYKLDGKTYGIAYNDNSTSAAALSAQNKTVNNQSRLEGVDMLIRPDVLNNSGNLLVAKGSDIQEWTFESAGEDKYYIKTTVGGTEKYIRINGNNVTLVDKSSASEIRAIPGTGANSGKWHFTAGNSLNFSGSAANGFNAAGGSGATTWLNLVEKSTLEDDDFVEYSARKISASDDILSATEKDEHGHIKHDDEGNVVYKEDKTKVVIYARVWNEETRKYEFYAVDHDGSLIRVYDSGDLINWVGNKVNSALWEFTEYTNADGTPSYYYELENTAHEGHYLAPQSEGIISDQPVGINLNGRRQGFDYTSIVAWDDDAYAYSGLKIVRNEDGSLKAVTCPLDEADDFHFAVIVPTVTPPEEEASPVTTVETVDNDKYGISIKMIDFNNNIVGERDVKQTEYLGTKPWVQADAYKAETGLVSTDLTDGYPKVKADTEMFDHSLSELFDDMTSANHLFIQSVYNESGYFEYDSTQNFAHLNDDGNFTVYNQLGAIGTTVSPTRSHGQFMPYNDISAEVGYAHDSQGNVITNQRDIKGNELPDTDPRKGEPLYSIPQIDADYYYGMELSAVFTQTPDGVDDWGHDIIFEFTGDDDFWFYVDGELVLDLGGVHSAIGGSVNFRTGEVNCNGTKTTLCDIFRSNYQARGKNPDDADALFVTKTVDGETVHVFNDYTAHEMKMFYMERGAGASNLKMRFNLASVKPGTVELSKKLKGIDNKSNKLIQYPYQIWYQTAEYEKNDDGTYALDENGNRIISKYNDPVPLEQPDADSDLTGQVNVVYKGTKTLIPYKESMTIGGITYNHVFLLKADETAVINFPEDTYRYKIVECGVDTAVYDHVYINGDEEEDEVPGYPYNNTDEQDPDSAGETLPSGTTQYKDSTRSDYGIEYDTTQNRPRVEYTNEVPHDVMRILSLKKELYDSNGEPLSDEAVANVKDAFSFRLYLGNEFADQDNLSPADMYTYYVKGLDGKYCKWDKASKKFVSLGVSTFEDFKNLSEDEQRLGTFTTSMYGSISKIPAGYTVEVHDLVVGTKYKVEEPDREIPRGYTRRDSDGYVRTDLADGNVVYYTDNDGTYGRHPEEGNTVTAEPISDTIADKTETPVIEIRNQKGWGLTAKKEWTDKDFMIHDPIYMAVYLDDGHGNPENPIDGTVRKLNTGDKEIYWFFQDLKINGEPHSFNEYLVREVVLTGTPSVDESTGVVTGYDTITPVDEGESIEVSGKTHSGNTRTETYTVNYDIGTSTGENQNIRTDIVTNSRPGIQIYKTDWWETKKLSGAVFTLKDSEGKDVGYDSYTSDSNGLVTTAYLSEGTFTLDEIKTPADYVALDEPITIKVTETEPSDYDLTVEAGTTTYYITLIGPRGFYETTPATESSMARITVKNRTLKELKVVKVDGETKAPISGVHFALYDQVKDSEGNVRPAYNPKTGYDDIATNNEGILTEITESLAPGTYYLREKAAPSGYKMLAEDLCFTIGQNGTVTINNSGYSSWLTRDTSLPGTVSYLMSIENTPLGITIRKTDEEGNQLLGSQFKLLIKNDTGTYVAVTAEGIGPDGLIDLTNSNQKTINGMQNGSYKLTETNAPPGYVILENDIFFNVSNGAVTLTDESGKTKEYSNVSLLEKNTTIEVKNTPGTSLPNSGGPGTRLFYIFGSILTAGCAILLIARRRVGAGAGKRS